MHRCVSLRSGRVSPKETQKVDAFCSDSASGHAFIRTQQSKDSQESLVCLAACAVHFRGRTHFFQNKKPKNVENAGKHSLMTDN